MTHHTTKTCRTCRRRYVNISKYGDPIGITPPGNPRLPWEPLAQYLPRAAKTIARRLEVLPRDVRRWQSYGLELHDADRIAVRIGLTAGEIWPTYWDTQFHICPTLGEPEEAAA